MNGQNTTGQTAQASTGSDQGSAPSNSNPFETSQTPAPTGQAEPSQSQTPAPSEPSQPTEPEGQTPQTPDPAQTPAAAPGLTPDALRDSIVAGIVAAQQRQQPAQPAAPAEPQMTPEQFRERFGIPTIDARVYEQLFGVAPDKPERVAALENLFHSHLRAGLKMAQEIYQSRIAEVQQQLQQQVAPLMTAHQRAQEAAIQTEFFGANPDLREEVALVNEVKDAMIARGVRFSSKEEMFKQVGAAARQLLARYKGQPVGGQTTQPGSQPTQPTGSRPSPRTMTPSSQGGRGGSSGSGSKPTTAEAVFGS